MAESFEELARRIREERIKTINKSNEKLEKLKDANSGITPSSKSINILPKPLVAISSQKTMLQMPDPLETQKAILELNKVVICRHGLEEALKLYFQQPSNKGGVTSMPLIALRDLANHLTIGSKQPQDDRLVRFIQFIEENSNNILRNISSLRIDSGNGRTNLLSTYIAGGSPDELKNIAVNFLIHPIFLIQSISDPQLRRPKVDALFPQSRNLNQVDFEIDFSTEVLPHFEVIAQVFDDPGHINKFKRIDRDEPNGAKLTGKGDDRAEVIKNLDGSVIAVLADGVSTAAGDRAAERALVLMQNLNKKIRSSMSLDTIETVIKQGVDKVSDELQTTKIYDTIKNDYTYDTASTLILLYVKPNGEYIALTLGDSFIEVYDQNQFLLNGNKNKHKNQYNALTKYLGNIGAGFTDCILKGQLNQGDKLILRSDGLEKADMPVLLQNNKGINISQLAEAIIKNQINYSDDKSIVIINYPKK